MNPRKGRPIRGSVWDNKANIELLWSLASMGLSDAEVATRMFPQGGMSSAGICQARHRYGVKAGRRPVFPASRRRGLLS